MDISDHNRAQETFHLHSWAVSLVILMRSIDKEEKEALLDGSLRERE